MSISLAPGSGKMPRNTAVRWFSRPRLVPSSSPSSTRATSRIRIRAPSASRITMRSNSSTWVSEVFTSRSMRWSAFSVWPMVAMMLLRLSAASTSAVPTLNMVMRSGSSQMRMAGNRPPPIQTCCTPGIAASCGDTSRRR